MKNQKVLLSLFEEQVKQALKWFDDPQRLGTESPLASPYFLGAAVSDPVRVSTAQGRGELLQEEIRAAAATLWAGPLPKTLEEMQQALRMERQTPGTARYAYLVLELRCFQRYLKPRRLADVWEHEDFLLGSKTEHYRDYDQAIQHLGAALLRRLCPPWRAEQPQVPATLFGYEAIQQRLLDALNVGQTVAISGAGGVGKTTLGAALTATIPLRATFWFTLRPTLNDHLTSLLFALGHFLHTHGASNLWQYLVASGGKQDDGHVALALVREDLTSLHPYAPLLCFDEFDRLRVWTPEETHPAHLQILEFVEGLCGAAPMLLLGQRPLLEADLQQTLTGLAASQIVTLWRTQGLPLASETAQQLYDATGGNPRLLLLYLALQREGEPLDELLTGLADRPGLLPIFRRLWLRLASDQRRLLQQVAVFRHFAPLDRWHPTTVQWLIEQRLLVTDRQGGIALLPALRDIIYAELSVELRQQLHLAAAEIRLELAEYTAAAYHYWQGGDETKAIRVWYPQRQREIERGQTDAALLIFAGISRQSVGNAERKALDLVRAELRQLRGELVQGLAELEAIDWRDQSEVQARVHALQGMFQEALGYPERAIQSYGEGITLVAQLIRQSSHLHYQRGVVHVRQRELAAAEQQTRLIEYELKHLQGMLHEEAGRYTDASVAYQHALILVRTLGNEALVAKTERALADLYGRQQKLAEALPYYENAIATYQRHGDRVNLEYTRLNLAATYLQCQQFQAAIDTGTPAYHFLATIGNLPSAAILAATLAEAYFELGKLAEAEQYAQKVLDAEERHPYPYALFTLGRIRRAQEVWPAAQAYFEQTAQIAQANGDPYLLAYAQREAGAVYGAMGQTQAATHALTAALHYFTGAAMTTEIHKTEQLLAPMHNGHVN